MTNTIQSTKVVTGKVRFSYLHVWEPAAIEEGGEKKYSASLIIPKTDTKTLESVRGAIEAALTSGIASKFGGKRPAKLKMPLRDGDEERPEDEAYAGCYFLNANCKTKPGVVDRNTQPVLDQDEVYSGCYGRASVSFYAFDTKGNKGVACGLNNLQKLSDGEPLGGRSSAESDFSAVPLDEDDFLG